MNARRSSETSRRGRVLRFPLAALTAVAGALLLLGAGCGLNTHGAGTGGNGGAGGSVTCNVDGQCNDENPCTTDSCGPDKTCVFAPLDGVDSPVQTAGNCLTAVCVKGEVVQKPDDGDVPDDHKDCTIDSCANGVASHVPKAVNTVCDDMGTAGLCDAQGDCVVQCTTNADCVSMNPCVTESCDAMNGVCVPNNLQDGTPTPGVAPVAGDCKVSICVNGMATLQNDDSDVPKTPTDCDLEECNSGVPSNPPVPIDTPCSTFMGNQAGFCDGNAASPTCRQCASDGDCPGPINDCHHPACVNFACTVDNTAAGMPAAGTVNPPQVVGDCQLLVCDGNGGTMNVVDDADPENDGNACTTDTCTGPDMTTHTPVANGMTCGNGGLLACLNGTCSGCTMADEAAECPVASCAGTMLTQAQLCNMSGQCVPTAPIQCSPYLCSAPADACTTKCNGDGDCDQSGLGNYCTGMNGSCLPKLPQGTACGSNHQCQAPGECVDGFCCNSACAGTCFACSNAKTGGANGTCLAVTNGTDPDNQCNDQGAASCKLNGLCNNGSCQSYVSGTVCLQASCVMSNAAEQLAEICDGNGNCVVSMPVGCAPYVCKSNACEASCNVDADCSQAGTGNYCTGAGGTCVPKEAQGGACVASHQCQAGLTCADGFCCNGACNAPCEACSAALKQSGMNNGACGHAKDGLADPHGLCAISAQASCGTDGCSNGNCIDWPNGTSCANATCVGATLTPAKACNGSGTCSGGAAGACPNDFACNPASMTCYAACGSGAAANDADCAPGYYCDGNGAGACQLKKAPGAGCSSNDVCASGICGLAGSGNCCSAACDVGGTCGASGCDGSGACMYPSLGTACGSSCSVATLTPSACDGHGSCVAGAPAACPGNLKCMDAMSCLAGCGTMSSNCVSPFACDDMGAGACKDPNGAACAANNACASNVCGLNGSGNCCAAACVMGGACGASGCAPGSGACTYPNGGCGTSCSNGMLTPSACNGGSCVAGVAADCPGNLKCADGSTCSVGGCGNNDSNCETGYYCDGMGAGACHLLIATGSSGCAGNDQCVSGHCGLDNGVCCTSDCPDQGAASCGNSGVCTLGTGVCQKYASGTSCGSSCAMSNMLTPDACDGMGDCVAGMAAACPGNLQCANGNVCVASCVPPDDSKCVSGTCQANGTCM